MTTRRFTILVHGSSALLGAAAVIAALVAETSATIEQLAADASGADTAAIDQAVAVIETPSTGWPETAPAGRAPPPGRPSWLGPAAPPPKPDRRGCGDLRSELPGGR